MARIAAILGALLRSFGRDLRSSWSLKGNNFFIASVVLLQDAGGFIYLVVGLVMLFPLSTDPLRRVPPSRLALWPLGRRDRWLLRATSPWLNPTTWLLAGLALWAVQGKVTAGLWGLFALLVGAGFAFSALPAVQGRGLLRRVPRMPSAVDELVRKNLRELLSTLDFYCALALSLSAVTYRFVAEPLPQEALVAITALTVLALSSHAQSLFGLDGAGGLTRYGLLPMRGWRILAAKDGAFLLVAAVLTSMLAPVSGAASALAALAVGHRYSVKLQGGQTRWRFSLGAPFVMEGLVQSVVTVVAAWSVNYDTRLLLLWLALWAGSIVWFGRELDRALGDR